MCFRQYIEILPACMHTSLYKMDKSPACMFPTSLASHSYPLVFTSSFPNVELIFLDSTRLYFWCRKHVFGSLSLWILSSLRTGLCRSCPTPSSVTPHIPSSLTGLHSILHIRGLPLNCRINTRLFLRMSQSSPYGILRSRKVEWKQFVPDC